MPRSKDPLPSLDELQRKIDAASPQGGNDEEKSPASRGLSDGMRMGVELVAGVGVGAAIGYFIDQAFSTMPFFFIVCFFLGAAAGFKNMVRSAGKSDDNATK